MTVADERPRRPTRPGTTFVEKDALELRLNELQASRFHFQTMLDEVEAGIVANQAKYDELVANSNV